MERLAREGQLKAFAHDGFWQCMDTYREQQLLERMWQKGRPLEEMVIPGLDRKICTA